MRGLSPENEPAQIIVQVGSTAWYETSSGGPGNIKTICQIIYF